jgi:hypothetical protein
MRTPKPEEVQKWAIIIGVGYLVFKFFRPLDTLLSIPGAIIEGGQNIIKKAGAAIKEGAQPQKPAPAPAPITTPGLSTTQLARIVDKPVKAKTSPTPLRTLPKSNASWANSYNAGSTIGYIFSAVNEKLTNSNKTWLVIHNAPGPAGKLIGYVALDTVTIVGASINGFKPQNVLV